MPKPGRWGWCIHAVERESCRKDWMAASTTRTGLWLLEGTKCSAPHHTKGSVLGNSSMKCIFLTWGRRWNALGMKKWSQVPILQIEIINRDCKWWGLYAQSERTAGGKVSPVHKESAFLQDKTSIFQEWSGLFAYCSCCQADCGYTYVIVGQKNYRCTLCDKSFTQKAHLESHMVIHTGEKNLKCDYCEKLFMRRQDLKQHVLTHTQ